MVPFIVVGLLVFGPPLLVELGLLGMFAFSHPSADDGHPFNRKGGWECVAMIVLVPVICGLLVYLATVFPLSR